MSNERREAEAIVLALYESIWAISDAVGFNIEAANKRVPAKMIDINSLSLRLLKNSMVDLSHNLELLGQLEKVLKWDTMGMGQTDFQYLDKSTTNS